MELQTRSKSGPEQQFAPVSADESNEHLEQRVMLMILGRRRHRK